VLTKEALTEYSREHLWYEVWMFFTAGSFKLNVPIQSNDPELGMFISNGMLEIFVLHLRNLLDFFYAEPRKTDVTAKMFFADSLVPSDFPVESHSLREARRRAHKEISHLTTERLVSGDPKKGWQFAGLMREMKVLVEAFRKKASSETLHPDFIKQVERLFASKGLEQIVGHSRKD